MPARARISVNALSSLFQSLADDIEMWRRLGVDHVGLISPKLAAVGWDESLAMITAAGFRVSNVAAERFVLEESLRLGAAVGAGTVYICSGRIGPGTWADWAGAFCADIAPFAVLARELGVRLAVEPTNPLRTDNSFVFSLRDALELARAADIAVVLDLSSCWYERDLESLVRDHVDRLSLVQVSDYVLGTFNTPNRAVPGDGDVPLARLLSMLLDAGYQGTFDIEILGPRIESEGYHSSVRRSVDRMGELLEGIGVSG
jgi:sugar phosphate isomerase/epimerase